MKKILLRFAFVIACHVTLIALFFTFERFRGRAAWRAYVEEARARGVELTLAEYLHPPIPDRENFAGVPIFADSFDVNPQGGKAKPFDIARPGKRPKWSSQSDGRRIDLEQWRSYFIEAQLLDDDAPAAPEAILKAVEHFAPEWQQVLEAASRPKTRFPVAWEKGFSALLPHLAILRETANLNTLRLEAHLAQSMPAAAYDDFRLGIRICAALEKEPALINGVVRVALLGQVVDAVWSGLAGGSWDDETLRKIEADLRPLNLLAEYHFAVHSERAALNAFYDRLLNPKGREMRDVQESIEKELRLDKSIGRAFPTGWLYRNQLRSNQFADAMVARVDPTKKVLGAGPDPDVKPRGWLDRSRYIFFYLAAPDYSGVEKRYVFAHTRMEQLRLACALERHRLARGTYPETLQAMVPDFVPTLPHDVIDGAPLRYQRTGEGGYLLYSIALNRQDDGGNRGTGDKPTNAPDWVWRGEGKRQVSPNGA